MSSQNQQAAEEPNEKTDRALEFPGIRRHCNMAGKSRRSQMLSVPGAQTVQTLECEVRTTLPSNLPAENE